MISSEHSVRCSRPRSVLREDIWRRATDSANRQRPWIGHCRGKTTFDVIHQCLLTFGHPGWSMDSPRQQRLRDVMGLEIGDGTAGVMKLVVARARTGRRATEGKGAASA